MKILTLLALLVPILSALSSSLSGYLRAMCDAEDAEGKARTGEVARLLGKSQSQVSGYRQRLIDRCLIELDGQGYARFLLPHIRDFYYSDAALLERKDPSQQWNRYR